MELTSALRRALEIGRRPARAELGAWVFELTPMTDAPSAEAPPIQVVALQHPFMLERRVNQ